MADDARTEARRRIAHAIARYDWNHGISANGTPGEHAYGEANAVLDLFPVVEYDHGVALAPSAPLVRRILMATMGEQVNGPVEPVTEEPTP